MLEQGATAGGVKKNIEGGVHGVYVSATELVHLQHIAKDLDISSRKPSAAIMEGTVRTKYKGRGMEFAEVRPYQPGDDVRTIDWRVTARMQSPYTKLFQEERERPVFLMVDQRAPMFFGTQTQFKSVFAAKLSAIIAWAAQTQKDRIGALIFSDNDQYDVRAKNSQHAVLNLLHQLVTANQSLNSPVSNGQAITMASMLTETSRIVKPGSLVFLLSDFHDFTPDCARILSGLSKRSDVTLLHVFDEIERSLPAHAHLVISNKKERLGLDTDTVQQAFHSLFDKKQLLLKQACANAAVQYLQAACSKDVAKYALEKFGKKFKGGRS